MSSDAVWKNEMWWDCKVDAKSFSSFKFRVSESRAEFKIHFDVDVSGSGLDIRFVLCTHKGFQRLAKWMKNKTRHEQDSDGQVVLDEAGLPVTVAVPEPKIATVFDVKTNILNRTAAALLPGKYALLLDNTHSVLTGKNLYLHVVETWNEKSAKKDLPVTQYSDGLPSDVAACMNDANECYVAGHYNQCAVMLRKGIELATKIKLLQSGILPKQLFDNAGNEIGLSAKIKLLKTKNLLTSKNSSDMEHIKWFGDAGAHGTMRVTEQDIKDGIEPKIRSLFEGLDLTA